MEFFEYGDKEISYLIEADQILGQEISRIGHVYREVTPDFYAALVESIISQQISAKAVLTVTNRFYDYLGEITPKTIANADVEVIQKFGITMRKAINIKATAEKVLSGELDIASFSAMPDDEIIRRLSALSGIGMWTAEMLMIFSLQRPNILSYGDLAIHRGLCRLYGLEKISKSLFAEYKQRYSPYASVASLYLWEISVN